jgi:hypothetical protein
MVRINMHQIEELFRLLATSSYFATWYPWSILCVSIPNIFLILWIFSLSRHRWLQLAYSFWEDFDSIVVIKIFYPILSACGGYISLEQPSCINAMFKKARVVEIVQKVHNNFNDLLGKRLIDNTLFMSSLVDNHCLYLRINCLVTGKVIFTNRWWLWDHEDRVYVSRIYILWWGGYRSEHACSLPRLIISYRWSLSFIGRCIILNQ